MTAADTEPVPTADDVRTARKAAATVAERTWLLAADRLPGKVQGIARNEARKVGGIGALLSAVLAVAISVAAYSSADNARATAATTSATMNAAVQRLDQANATLVDRGQSPVPLPPTSPTDPAPAVSAAVLAQVLASLPTSPSPDAVASRIQGAAATSLLGPSTDELAGQVAGYFSQNPPQSGPPVTEPDIRAAVDAALRDNPPASGAKGDPCLPSDPACVGQPGANGLDGADGKDGSDGIGVNGIDGKNGADGKDGRDGADSTVPGPVGPRGEPGPACPDGTSLQPVTFASGQTGQGCVDGGPPP